MLRTLHIGQNAAASYRVVEVVMYIVSTTTIGHRAIESEIWLAIVFMFVTATRVSAWERKKSGRRSGTRSACRQQMR